MFQKMRLNQPLYLITRSIKFLVQKNKARDPLQSPHIPPNPPNPRLHCRYCSYYLRQALVHCFTPTLLLVHCEFNFGLCRGVILTVSREILTTDKRHIVKSSLNMTSSSEEISNNAIQYSALQSKMQFKGGSDQLVYIGATKSLVELSACYCVYNQICYINSVE